MVNGSKIGEAYVELRARVDRLEAELAQARAASSQTADQMSSDAKRSADAVERGSSKVEESLRAQSSAFTSLIGRVTASVAAMVSFYNIGTKIRDLFTPGSVRVDEFLSGIAKNDLQTRLKLVSEEIDQLNARASAARNTFSGWWANVLMDGEQAVSIEAKVNQLLKTQTSLRQAIASQNRAEQARRRADEQRKFDADAIKAQDDVANAIRQNIDEVESARRESLERQADDERKFVEAAMRAQEELAEEIARSRQQAAEQVRSEARSARQELEAWRRQLNERGGATDIRRLARAIHVASLRNMGR